MGSIQSTAPPTQHRDRMFWSTLLSTILAIHSYQVISGSNDYEDIVSKLKNNESIVKTSETKLTGVNCTFITSGYQAEGFCTFFGSCRVENTDYMYKGGCGELVLWGENEIQERNHPCTVWVEEISVRQGQCSESGDCVAKNVTRENDLECVYKTSLLKSQKTSPRQLYCKRESAFLDSIFPFLGGLGSALNFLNCGFK